MSTGAEPSGEAAPGRGQRLDGRLAILRDNSAQGGSLQERPFIDQPTARVLLEALGTLPTSSRQDLESAISQLEGLRQSYALPRPVEARASDMLVRLRARLRDLPPPGDAGTAAPGRPALEAATAHAILDALSGPEPLGRQGFEAAAAQLAGLKARHTLPPDVLDRADGLLTRWEAGVGCLPPNPQDHAIMAYLNALAFEPKGSGLPPLAGPAGEQDEVRTFAARPLLHPEVRLAVDRALAFAPHGPDEGRSGLWERPSLWSLSPLRLQGSIFRQTQFLLEQYVAGQPHAVGLLATLFGGDAGRLRAFAGELAGRAPRNSRLQRLALHVRDTASAVAETGITPRPHAPPWSRPVTAPFDQTRQDSIRRLLDAMIGLTKVQL